MLAITNGKIFTPEPVEGVVLIEQGKITAVGKLEVPPDAEVIDAQGMWVLPGFIDAHTHLGICEETYRIEGDDTNEMTEPVTPHLRALDAVNPEDEGLQDAVAGGITTVFAAPGSGNVVGGTGLVMKTYGKIVDKMVLREPAGLKIAFGENPKRVYGEDKKMPMTRMGTAGLMRESLVKAQNYQESIERGKTDPAELPERDLRLEVLLQVLRREIPLRAHAHRADDIMTAVRIAREFDVDLVIEHCTEGHKIAAELAEAGIPAVVGPSLSNRAKIELKDITYKTPGILAKAGVKVALMTDHPVIPIQYLPISAGLAIREGMSQADALKALTINPAEILGVADRVGSLAPGKDADVVVWSGNPFELASKPKLVLIDGKIVFSDHFSPV
ncbi:MAG: amidohydrolase [Peptococcaceae bacterium]|nr:amidohydrolase [Peptococcaceae bacterium]